MIDVAAHFKDIKYTVPTKASNDPDHATKMRLDYAFVSDSIIGSIAKFNTVHDNSTNIISDHYPLVIDVLAPSV